MLEVNYHESPGGALGPPYTTSSRPPWTPPPNDAHQTVVRQAILDAYLTLTSLLSSSTPNAILSKLGERIDLLDSYRQIANGLSAELDEALEKALIVYALTVFEKYIP